MVHGEEHVQLREMLPKNIIHHLPEQDHKAGGSEELPPSPRDRQCTQMLEMERLRRRQNPN